MPHATRSYHPRMAVIFDFDGTLAPDSTKFLLKRAGEDPEKFMHEHRKPLEEAGWDSIIANMYCLLKLAEQNKDFTLSRESFREIGREIELFRGVPEMFGKVRAWVRQIAPDAEVEFYLLSSGFVDIFRHTSIAAEFKEMWGSEFHFDEQGKAVFVKQIISHPEKMRYILQMAKGTGTKGPNGPADVYREVSDDDWHMPLDQVVYLGDGVSDLPAFSLMNERGGLALGVVDADQLKNWSAYGDMHKNRRVQNLTKADFSEGSELMTSLRLSVEVVAKLLALRRLGKGE